MRPDLIDRVSDEVDSLITSIKPLLDYAKVRPDLVRQAAALAIPAILEDLEALTSRDSAARNSPDYVWSSYLSFHALLAYRVAHTIYSLRFPGQEQEAVQGRNAHVSYAARRMAEEAKSRTGVEIHPAASIGHRMVIDHGWGTVIGEQAQVGDDCYFLQNVTLGCRRIGTVYGIDERRHPTIGNRVVLAGDVWVFGPVTIGDDCRIDPGARITEDVPAGAHVRVVTKLQLTQLVGQLRPGAPA